MKFKVGDLIAHVSGTGLVYEVVKSRPACSDQVAISLEVDPKVTRIIDPENWKIMTESKGYIKISDLLELLTLGDLKWAYHSHKVSCSFRETEGKSPCDCSRRQCRNLTALKEYLEARLPDSV